MVSRRDLVAAVLLTFCVTASLFTITMTRGQGGNYDPWLDINNDGYIGIDDIYTVATHFGIEGTPVAKGSIEYDSGWINIQDKAGQNVTIVNNLNLNMNDANLGFDITGKTSLDDQKVQRHLGLTDNAQWNKTYGRINTDVAHALVQTAGGGYALAGYATGSYGAGSKDFWLVKTDASGNAQWNKTYDYEGTYIDDARALVQTSDGGYALAGYTTLYGAGTAVFWLVKTDASGNAQWNKTYGRGQINAAYALVQTSDGGFALAGCTDLVFWLVKTDVNGNAQWNKTYGGAGGAAAQALVQTADGGYALAGYRYSYVNADFWLVKTDVNGNAQWNKSYGGTYDDEAYALVQTADGGYALAGYTHSYGAGGYDFWLVKTDAESGLAWVDSNANSITLHRGLTDMYWNYVRVRVWKPRETHLFTITMTRGQGSGYDPWLDINDDGYIGVDDIYTVATHFGIEGTPVAKGSIEYDSGWINIQDKAGQNVAIVNNLNLNMNDASLGFDITGKTSLDDQKVQRHLCLARSAQWNQTYGGTSDDWAYALVQTSDGGYALAGSTDSYGAGGTDFWLVKTDANANAQWNQTYGGTSWEQAYALVQTGDGGYALAGSTSSYGDVNGDAWLVKTDVNGNAQWNQTYGGTSWEQAYALVQTADGGYALAGHTWSYGAGGTDFWLVKTDVNGNAQWNQTYGGTSDDWVYALVQTSDGGYALAGYTFSYGVGSYDFWLVKTDVNGNAQWNKTYGGIGWDAALALVQTGDGGYALAGITGSFGAGNWDFWLVKTDVNGNAQWNQTYGGTYDDFAWALVQTADGGYALAGYTSSFGAGGGDFWLVKTDADGNAQWNQTYGGTGSDGAFGLVETVGGGYALAGRTDSFGAGGYAFWLVKTDAESGLAWVDSDANSITLHRGLTDMYWNYVRVRVWKPRETP